MQAILDRIGNWKFDPVTSILTVVIVPTGVYVLIRIRGFFKQAIGHLLDGIVYTLNKIVVHRVAASLTLRRYCRLQLAGPTKYLRVPASTEISIDIDRIFVPLVLENQGLSSTYDSLSLLDAGTRVRVVGDPGSGKSSAAKKLFRDVCRRATFLPASSRFPIFLELRNLEIPKTVAANKLGDWIVNHIKTLCASYEVYNLEQCFDVYANKTGLLIILDGLDEVSSTRYPRIALALNALSTKLQQLGENNAVVLTLRAQFHQQTRADFEESFPTVLSVKRFSPTDIFEFLSRWPFANENFENVVRIYNDLTDRPSLREMCTNPLVLSMYVAQDQIGGYQIAPDSRTEFYSKVAEELLIKRRAKQIGAFNAQAAVRDQRQRVLGKIAFNHLCDPDQSPNHLDWSDAVDIVMSVVGSKTKDDASTYLRDLAKETGLIGEEQEGESFRFVHLTFCEFFCAYEAVHGRSDGWAALLSSHRGFQQNSALTSRLVEALPFATALLPRHMRENALEQIWACNDLHLSAMAFLETKYYAHPLWPEFVDRSIASLEQSSEDSWDADWLRELHLFLVVASDAERTSRVTKGVQKSDAVAMFFRQFARREAKSLSRLVANYAEQDAAAAFRVATLCGIDLLNDLPDVVVSSCNQPPFVAVALERALREPELTSLWASLFAEGGLRSRAGASTLSNRIERPWQSKVTQEVPARMRWTGSGFYSDSFYIDCLSLGCHANFCRAETPLLNILSTISPPNKLAFWPTILNYCARSWPVFIFAMIGSVAAVPFVLKKVDLILNDNQPNHLSWENNLIGFGSAALLLVPLALAVAGVNRQRLYRALLNERLGYGEGLQDVVRMMTIIIAKSSKTPKVTEFEIDEEGNRKWPSFACRGLFRSSKLVAQARQLIIKREALSGSVRR
jgi:hypothetical protein